MFKTLLQVIFMSCKPQASSFTSPHCCMSAGAAERAAIPALSFYNMHRSDVSPTATLSLTAKWIDTDFFFFCLKHRVTYCTMKVISQTYANMFEIWHADTSEVHVVVKDSVRKKTQAVEDSQTRAYWKHSPLAYPTNKQTTNFANT